MTTRHTMVLDYYRCDTCGLKGVYAVPGRPVVRCKYCRKRWASLDEITSYDDTLRRSLRHDGVSVAFQPIVRLDGGEVVGAEALLRWGADERRKDTNDANHTVELVALAGATGLLGPLGAWTVAEACQRVAGWNEGRETPLFVTVNVANCQLGPVFTALVEEALDESGLAPHLLWLEVARSDLTECISTLRSGLDGLAGLGVTLALDNFGVGCCSLVDLLSLPIGALKIDRALTGTVANDESTEVVLQSMVELAGRMRWEVVAVGVEREEQSERLLRLGCRLAQGHLWSEGLAGDVFARCATGGAGSSSF